MERKKYFIDIAHMHPICPLSLSHARIFVLADVWARWKRKQGFSVRFPICMHYSGSTVFKIVSAVSKFLKNQKLSDSEQKTLDLIFNFYKIPKENLCELNKPINLLDYFSDVILKDLKNIQISCDYAEYFNTDNQLYQEFVRAVFDIYREKGFITRNNNNSRSLNYSSPLFRALAVDRLNKTTFSPPTARIMVTDSLKNLDNEWSFERNNSIGTYMDGYFIDPMFDSEFLSIFNAIYPYLKNLSINRSNARDIFKEFLYKIDNPDKKVSFIANELYSKSLEILPVDIFFVERHLQNWVAKRIYTEAILLPQKFSTKEYFFLGSITVNRKIDSASRGIGITLSQLIREAGAINSRMFLLYTFDTHWRDTEWNPSFIEEIHGKIYWEKIYRFVKFFKLLKIRSTEKNFNQIFSLIEKAKREIEHNLSRGSTKKVIKILIEDLPRSIYALTERQEKTDRSQEKTKEQILHFFLHYIEIICPPLLEKLSEK
jgi:leucyl-tRNA synthetase